MTTCRLQSVGQALAHYNSLQRFDHREWLFKRPTDIGWQQCGLVSMLWVLVVLVVLVVGRMVRGQWRSVYPRVVKGTVAFVPAASLHHEVTTHRPLGHV